MKKVTIGAAILAGTMMVSGHALAAGKTLVFCSEASPEGFDAALYSGGETIDASANQMFDGLVNFVVGSTDVEAGVAQSWSVSDDGLEVTFKLRPGVKFHSTKYFTPSRELNADDILFTFNRQRNENDPYYQAVDGKFLYFGWMDMGKLIKDIVKVDDLTVKFVLDHPEAPIVANLAMAFASIQSAEYAAKLVAEERLGDLSNKPIGTGPFKFIAYQKDATIRYTRNDDYWGKPANIENLIFSITTDPSVRYQKLKAGECDVIAYPLPADLAAIEADPNIALLSQEGLNVGYLGYNTEKKPFTDPKVRKALNHAMNKDVIKQVVFEGNARVATNPIPPTMWSYNTSVQDDAYDPELAKKLLAEAGYPDGFETDLWAMPVSRPYNPDARKMAELIQADWAAIGVKAEIVSYEWGEYRKRLRSGEHSTALNGWTGDNGDPDNFLRVLLGCAAADSTVSRWCDEAFEEQLQIALKSSDKEVRTQAYLKAQEIFKREAPWATIAHSIVFVPVNKRVTGYKVHPLSGNFFHIVDVK